VPHCHGDTSPLHPAQIIVKTSPLDMRLTKIQMAIFPRIPAKIKSAVKETRSSNTSNGQLLNADIIRGP
jgi:hypothetical protein